MKGEKFDKILTDKDNKILKFDTPELAREYLMEHREEYKFDVIIVEMEEKENGE